MQKLWRVVEAKGVVSRKEGAAIRYKLRHVERSWRAISKELAAVGVTNGGGRPIHPYQLEEMVHKGVAKLHAYLNDRTLESAEAKVGWLLREKVNYSRSTEEDPHLWSRLGWQKYRKVGRKPTSGWYEQKTE